MQVAEEMDFRFRSRREYEEEMKRVISLKNSSKGKRKGEDPEELEELYENLMEEYLSFCASEEDAQ